MTVKKNKESVLARYVHGNNRILLRRSIPHDRIGSSSYLPITLDHSGAASHDIRRAMTVMKRATLRMPHEKVAHGSLLKLLDLNNGCVLAWRAAVRIVHTRIFNSWRNVTRPWEE
jgi:hypothetical protein